MIRLLPDCILERWVQLHQAVRLGVVLALMMILGVCGVKPAFRTFKHWRTGQNLKAAKTALDRARMDQARDLALSVLHAGNAGIETYRILERSAAALNDPRYGEVARALMTHPDATVKDRLRGFRGIAGAMPMGLVGQAWGMLPESCHSTATFASAFARRLTDERRFDDAERVLLQVPQANRTRDVDLVSARMWIHRDKRGDCDNAQRWIADTLPSRDDSATGPWLELLETIPVARLRADLLEPVRGVLDSQACGGSARAALMLARIDYAADISRRTQTIATAIARWKPHEPVALAKMLADLGLYQTLLDALPPQLADEHGELFPYFWQAMLRCGAWRDAARLLDRCGGRLPKYEELACRAVIAGRTKDTGTREQVWQAALAEAELSPDRAGFVVLERLAKDAGMVAEAEQALVEAIRRKQGALPLYEDLKPLLASLAKQGRDNTLLEIGFIYLRFEPDNPVLLTQYAYLASVNHLDDPGAVLKAMEDLRRAYPDESSVQCVLAAVLLCEGQYERAAHTLDSLRTDPARLTPGFQAVYLTAQVLSHRIDKDDPRVTNFPWQSLQASERRKFQGLLYAAN